MAVTEIYTLTEHMALQFHDTYPTSIQLSAKPRMCVRVCMYAVLVGLVTLTNKPHHAILYNAAAIPVSPDPCENQKLAASVFGPHSLCLFSSVYVYVCVYD